MAKPIPVKRKRKTASAPAVKSAVVKEVLQKIITQFIFEDLVFDPKYVPHMFVSNVIQRSLARIMGQGPNGPVTAKCTADGSLAVVARGGAFDDYERQDHTFAITEAARVTDSTVANHLMDASENFLTDGILVGARIKNTTDTTYANVTAVASGDLTLDADIMVSGESYVIIPQKIFTLNQQVNRIDLFTYDGSVDYQLTRDTVKAFGSKIELFTDSFYSLDFDTLKVKATCGTFTDATPTRVKLVGWFREGG